MILIIAATPSVPYLLSVQVCKGVYLSVMLYTGGNNINHFIVNVKKNIINYVERG